MGFYGHLLIREREIFLIYVLKLEKQIETQELPAIFARCLCIFDMYTIRTQYKIVHRAQCTQSP